MFGFHIAALISRIGVYYTVTILRNPRNSIGNYLGPYSRVSGFGLYKNPKLHTHVLKTRWHTPLSARMEAGVQISGWGCSSQVACHGTLRKQASLCSG